MLNSFDLKEFINNIIFYLPVLLISLTAHEVSHGFAAYKLGDKTAKYDGRLSFNPIRHIDPMGFICMIASNFRFGWAKPVMVNPNNLKNPKVDMALISAAGPASNLVLAFVTMMILYPLRLSYSSVVYTLLINLILVNISLCVFNLIPFPPLDGSKIFAGLLPNKYYYRLPRLGQASMLILMVLVFTGVVGGILWPMITFVFNQMHNLVSLIYRPFI